MGAVVRMDEWRERAEAGLTPEERAADRSLARLERAVAGLDAALEGKARSEAPAWLVTEVFAIQGCISMELAEEAADRAERALEKWKRHESRRRG